jgi:hypothetical protein
MHFKNVTILTFVPCIFVNSMINQQMHKWSTIYYTTLVAMTLCVSTPLHHPQGSSYCVIICRMLFSGWFTSICSLNANVSEDCVCSIFIGG